MIKMDRHLFRLNTFSYHLWITMLLVCLQPLAISHLAAEEGPLLSMIPLRAYTTEQGLSQNSITDIRQDDKGFIWVATENGLNRMEGEHIRLMNDAENKLLNHQINRFLFDRQGNIWAATISGLLKVTPEIKVSIYNLPGAPEVYTEMNYLTGIDLLDEDKLLLASWRGIFYLDTQTEELNSSELNKALDKQNLRIATIQRWNKRVLLGTNHGLWLMDEANRQLQPVAESVLERVRRIRKITPTGDNQWLIASDSGLFTLAFDQQQWQAHLIFEGDVLDVVIKGDLGYFAVYDKIYQLQLSSQKTDWLFALRQQLPRFSSYKIKQLFLDRKGSLWIGTESQGLYLWSTRSRSFLTLSQLTEGKVNRLSHPLIWSFYAQSDHQLWIGTENGLNYLEPDTGKWRHILTRAPEEPATGLESIYWLHHAEDYLWAATAKGLVRVEMDSFKYQLFRPSFARQGRDFMVYYITSLNNKLWLATNQGLVVFDPDSFQFQLESRINARPGTNPVYFVRAEDGWLWLGDGRQLRRFNPDTGVLQSILTLATSDTDLDVAISDFYRQGNKLWISTSGNGLFQIDLNSPGKVVRHFDVQKGLADNIIYRIIPWKQRLLLTSHSGLIVLDPQSGHAIRYDYYDGLTSNEFNEGAAYQLDNGLLLFGTANGLVALQPENLSLPKIQESPTLISIHQRSGNRRVEYLAGVTQPLQFAPDTDYLIFEWSMLDYTHPNRWTYQARLSGEDYSIEQTNPRGQIVLANIPPGRYQLQVQASSDHGALMSKPRLIHFEIEAPLWSTLSVRTAQFTLLALLIFWLLYRRSQVKKAVLELNQQLLEKDERLELALLDRYRGVWDWHLQSGELEESVITIVHSADHLEELRFKEYLQRVPASDREATVQVWKNFLTGNVRELHVSYPYQADNKLRWIRATGRVTDIDEKGTVLRATGTWQDISETKSKEDRLHLLTQAFESTRDVILIVDHQFNIVEVNMAYDRLTGFKGKQLIGRQIEEIAFNRISREAADEIKQMIRVHGQWQGETTLPKRNGPSFPVEVRVDVLGELGAKNYFVVTMSDNSGTLQQATSSSVNAYYDNLTGYPNQALASDRLAHAIEQAKSNKTNVVLVTIELAQFDFHLQTIGKDAVSRLILEMGKRIAACIERDDTLARTGQDRFAIIMENRQNLLHTVFVIKNILDALKTPILIDQVPIKIVAAAGISSYPQDGRNANQVFSRSVEALSLARKIGNHQFNYFSPETNKRALDKLAMKARLSTALENNEFFLVYQPKFEIRTGKQIGFEVFLRWRLEDGNIIYPSQFISLAEDLNLVMPITEWLINSAFRTLRRWKDEKLHSVFAINLFPSQSVDNKLVQYLMDKLDEYQLDPSILHIELNETAIAREINKGTQLIKELAVTGFRVTLDEFGKGQISLTEVSQLPLYAVKVSREYVRDIGELPSSDALLKSVAYLATQQNWIASAKGIENDSQLDFLLDAGFVIGQGYYFSDPLEESAARDFMIKHGV